MPDFGAADWVVLSAGVLLMLAVSILQERGVSVRVLVAQRSLPVRWSVYFAALFAIILFGVYGDGYQVGTFLYGNF